MKTQTLAAISLAAGAVSAMPYNSQFPKHTVKRASGFADGTTVATFWGQSTEDLSDVCADASFDTVIMAFVTSLNPPKLNFGKDTGSPSSAQSAKSGWSLFDGTQTGTNGKSLAEQISGCQQAGKKVMISFGGDKNFSNATFSSSDEAKQAADYLWNLFLGGTDSQDLRPFGSDVTLDGVDLDNETGDGSYYEDLVTELRSKMNGNSTKQYYISAEPMCSFYDQSDSSIPDKILPQLDFINVQFYNNQQQGIGGSDFKTTIQAWAKKFANVSPSPKLFLGIPGGPKAATYNTQSVDEIKTTIESVKNMNLTGFGGVGIWDAGNAMQNTGFAAAVKSALG
ncbi:Endochitinase 3 [Cytospora mali]|uniref:chitinase n=1 Tax=Cytospora mali TaxID=578113 RepID=A0A194V2E5_CYTMA|nr:Endochitinase 3 [Valsa mali var. pyri (nom. inval.)]